MLQVLAHIKDRESRKSQRMSQPSEGSEAFIERADESKGTSRAAGWAQRPEAGAAGATALDMRDTSNLVFVRRQPTLSSRVGDLSQPGVTPAKYINQTAQTALNPKRAA